MKKFFISFLAISFAVIAVFGFLDMNIGHSDCIMKIANGGSICPHDSALDFVVFHIGALKNFSLAIFDLLIFAAAAIIISLFLRLNFLKHFINFNDLKFESPDRYSYGKKISWLAAFATKIKISHWLALCEKRDPSLSL